MQDALTPMMQQYQRLRKSIPADTLLLFRLGDFYELFFEDAKEASVLLNVALTKRNEVPMCGVPYHAAPGYIAKLIKAGRRVAICDQTSEAQPGKIVSRDITQIISAGTVSELNLLDAKRANYLGAVYVGEESFGFAYADLTTGEFRLIQLQDRQSLLDQLARVGPSELLMSAEQKESLGELNHAIEYDSYAFLPEHAGFTLCEHFQVKSLDGFGCGQMPQAVAAAGAIVHYLKHQLRRKIDHLSSLRCDAPTDYVLLDAATQNNLELVESRSARDTSLLAVLDRTATPMGARKLRSWILQPLRDLAELGCRQQMIADLLQEPELLDSIRTELKSIRDIERAVGRLSQASGNARDLVALKTSLQQIPTLKRELQKLLDRLAFGRASTVEAGVSPATSFDAQPGRLPPQNSLTQRLQNEIQEMPALAEKLSKALVDDPPLPLKEGGLFGADERARNLEYELFQKVREETLRELGPIQRTAEAIAILDVICSLAETARLFNYCRPTLNESLRLLIKDGRHPVLDQNLVEEKFVPNDITLDGESMRLAIVTGPNMAGKSTYIRQVALIVLMAQIGSFVPAASAEIGLVDRIFTRVGANDDIGRGQSTFMVEMNETSNIVNNATERSLVILDEIGRGTSTFDGLSIAWSVAEFLHDKIKARSLFATHYHELTKLAAERKGVCNFNVAVREWNEQIIFLRKIVPGGADKSYGIQVARLAGLPKEILDRAKEILSHLENPNGAVVHEKKKRRSTKSMPQSEKPQLDLL